MDEEDGLEDVNDFDVTLRIRSSSVTPDNAQEASVHHSNQRCSLLGEDRGPVLIPEISMSPCSGGTGSDDGHSSVSLTSYPNSGAGSPIFQPKTTVVSHQHDGVNQNGSSNLSWMTRGDSPRPQSEEEAKDFFAYRNGILGSVIPEIHRTIEHNVDGSVKGTWLLTEIDSWNHEWERIVLLCEKVLVIFKYDFIGMKIEDTRRLELGVVDKVVTGALVYPENSLTPKLNGIAGGIAGVVKDCIIPTVHGTVQSVGGAVWRKNRCANPLLEQGVDALEEENSKDSDQVESLSACTLNGDTSGEKLDRPLRGTLMSALSLEKFEPKTRKAQGVHIIWNETEPVSFHQRWNPFSKSIPRLTLTSHPLYWHKGGEESVVLFDVDSFVQEFMHTLGQGSDDLSPCCRVEYKPIVIESYVGIASLLHNANSLGFYKVRGKVSF